MVRELFGVEPDPWQDNVLSNFPKRQRIAMPASKGPGKTTTLAWIAWNFLLTRENPKCAATSITGDNLRDNLWTEMAKWQQKSPLLSKMFTWTRERIFANENPEQWWVSARTYPKDGDATKQADTLAGLHADYILFLIDESGSMGDAIMASAEAALSSCIEGHIVQAGNPTQLAGPLYRAVENKNGLWYVVRITSDPDDPERSPRVDKKWAQDFIDNNGGRDNDWVRTTILGLFPRASANALIGPDEVRAAMKRYYRSHELGRVPRIMGIDVARYGDDLSVVAKREGLQMHPFVSYRGLSSTEGAAIVNREWGSFEPDGVFIDDTGGFGSGWIDQLALRGRNPIGVHFASSAHDKLRFANRRAEMYFLLAEWIKKGGALPENESLVEDLSNTNYSAPKGVLIIEPKELVKAKQMGRSPDSADAAALTFAEPLMVSAPRGVRGRMAVSYDPFEMLNDLDRSSEKLYDAWQ